MKILVVNGSNLNMLGKREPELYGKRSYKDLTAFIRLAAKEEGVKVKIAQSNYEGKLVEILQKARNRYDGVIINPGGYTHTSVSIADAIKAAEVPAVEVHITDLNSREEFRRVSMVRPACVACVMGEGFDGYKTAIKMLKDNLKNA